MSTRSTAVIVVVLLGIGAPARGQDVQFGTELDVLPYATGGWYVSGWWGRDHVRVRAVASDVNLPDFTLKGDFEEGESRTYAGLVDYFPRAAFRDPWIGAGVEHWKNRVGHPAESLRATTPTG